MEIVSDTSWNGQTEHFFSCRWYLRQGTIVRNHIAVISSSKGGIEIWKQINDGKFNFINAIYDTRRLNRKLRQFKMEN